MEPKFRKQPQGALPVNCRQKKRRELVRWPLRKLHLKGPTFRDYSEYRALFGDVLRRGNRVLDIGTGGSNFVEMARAEGINAIGIDAGLGERFGVTPKKPNALVKAIAQELPFPANRFDAVISNYGPIWHGSDRSKRQAIIEALRVLKIGGKLKISPPGEHFLWAQIDSEFDTKMDNYGVFTITKTRKGSLEKLRKIWGIK